LISPIGAACAGRDQRTVLRDGGGFEAHDALLCVAEGTGPAPSNAAVYAHPLFQDQGGDARPVRGSPRGDAKQRGDRAALLLPSRTRMPIMPRFVREAPKDSTLTLDEIEASELRQQAGEGWSAAQSHRPAPGLTRESYLARLDFELDVIVKMRFPAIF